MSCSIWNPYTSVEDLQKAFHRGSVIFTWMFDHQLHLKFTPALCSILLFIFYRGCTHFKVCRKSTAIGQQIINEQSVRSKCVQKYQHTATAQSLSITLDNRVDFYALGAYWMRRALTGCVVRSVLIFLDAFTPGGLTLTHKCYPPVYTHLQIGP